MIAIAELAPEKSAKKAINNICLKAKESLISWEGASTKLIQKPTFEKEYTPGQKPITIIKKIQYSFSKSIKTLNKKNQLLYSYYNYDCYVYYLRKIDRFNDAIELDISTSPMCRRIDTFVRYRGFAFEYRFMMPSFTPMDQSDADLYLEVLMQVMDNLENKYLVKIAQYYPKTPDWFVY